MTVDTATGVALGITGLTRGGGVGTGRMRAGGGAGRRGAGVLTAWDEGGAVGGTGLALPWGKLGKWSF